MSGIDRFGASSSAHTIEDQPRETNSPVDTSRPQTPEQSAGPSGASHSEVAEFLEHQRPDSPSSIYSQESARRDSQDFPPLPNPHDPDTYKGSDILPNPFGTPGHKEAFVDGPNPLAVPTSEGLGISAQDIKALQFKAANETIMARSASAVQGNRRKNQAIQNDPSTPQFTAGNHPALSRAERRGFQSEAKRAKTQRQTQTPGPTLGKIKEEKQADARAAALAAEEKSKAQFGMDDEEYNRRFAKG